jgi:hypothetical protein
MTESWPSSVSRPVCLPAAPWPSIDAFHHRERALALEGGAEVGRERVKAFSRSGFLFLPLKLRSHPRRLPRLLWGCVAWTPAGTTGVGAC